MRFLFLYDAPEPNAGAMFVFGLILGLVIGVLLTVLTTGKTP